MPRFASVVLEIPVDKQFDFLVPPEFEGAVAPGVRVRVPFRSRGLSAYVVSVAEGRPHPGAKPILSVRDRRPVIGEPVMRLAEWMASYYYCPLPAAIRCILPSGVRAGLAGKTPLFAAADPARVMAEGGAAALRPARRSRRGSWRSSSRAEDRSRCRRSSGAPGRRSRRRAPSNGKGS